MLNVASGAISPLVEIGHCAAHVHPSAGNPHPPVCSHKLLGIKYVHTPSIKLWDTGTGGGVCGRPHLVEREHDALVVESLAAARA